MAVGERSHTWQQVITYFDGVIFHLDPIPGLSRDCCCQGCPSSGQCKLRSKFPGIAALTRMSREELWATRKEAKTPKNRQPFAAEVDSSSSNPERKVSTLSFEVYTLLLGSSGLPEHDVPLINAYRSTGLPIM